MSEDEMDVEAGQGGDAEDSSPRTVPLAALQAERGHRQTLERQLAELKGTVNTLKESQSKPKEYTKPDLQAAVDSGRISQERADQLWEDQQARTLEAKVSGRIETRLQEQTRTQRIQAEIDRYKAWNPSIMDDGSKARAAVAEAYGYHVNDLGKPESLETELDALITAFGPASKLQKAKGSDPETHQEVGSDGGEAPKAEDKAPKGLSPDARKYYGKQIEQGLYKDWTEVKALLDKASPRVKQRLGA